MVSVASLFVRLARESTENSVMTQNLNFLLSQWVKDPRCLCCMIKKVEGTTVSKCQLA